MQWKFENSRLIGPITFNSDLSGVKKLIGDPSDNFQKTSRSNASTYVYDNKGVHLNFDNDGNLSLLTIFPDNEVFIGAIQLLGKQIELIYSELTSAGIMVEPDDVGLWCEAEKILLINIDGIVDGVEIYPK